MNKTNTQKRYEELKQTNSELAVAGHDQISQEQYEILSGLVSRVAKETSHEEFAAFVRDGELPPIALTGQEMELVLAGCKICDIGDHVWAIIKRIIHK